MRASNERLTILSEAEQAALYEIVNQRRKLTPFQRAKLTP